MLDRTDFASWQQWIRLYCRGKDNEVNILKSIDEGPYKSGTFKETLAESTEGTPQFGLPKDIYTLINHYTNAKDIWDNVKMLLEWSELTKEDRESQLYDDFEHFRQHKEESIHDYYTRFAKLINDIRNIKMTMSKLQLNSKFINNMLPEWGRFVTAVKLDRGLRDSNYDQLFAYLKQHKAHAKENKMMLERLSQPIAQPTADPLALLSNVSNTQHGSPPSSTSSFTQLPPPHANSSSPGRPNRGQEINPRGGNAIGYGEAQNRVGNVNQGQARPGQARTVKCYNCNGAGHIVRNCTQPKRLQNSKYFKDKMLLMQAQENGVALDAEQLIFLAGGQGNAFDDDVDEQPVQDLALNMDNVFQAEDSDPITDEARPSYDSDILSEVQDHDQYLDDTCAYHEEHVMHDSVQLDHGVDLHADYTSVSNMIPYDQYVKDNEVPVVHSNASSVLNDTFMMIYNDMCEPSAPSVSNKSRNAAVKTSLTAKLATYMEQVELYERRAKFKLTEREQKINEQLRLVISDLISDSNPVFNLRKARRQKDGYSQQRVFNLTRDYFISVHPQSNVRLSALLPDSEEKSSVHPHNFSSMILQKIIWNSHIGYTVVAKSIIIRLHFALAFWFRDLVLRFGAAFWFCVLLIEDNTMADVNVNAPAGQSPTMAPPTRKTAGFNRPRHPVLQILWETGVNILTSIDEGPFLMGTVREPLTEGTEGAPNLGLERPRIYSDLSPEEKDWYNADIQAINILLQGLPKDIYTLINHYTDAKDIWDNVKMLLEGSELTKEDRES
nr:hypothetical protein [Tanacetum cinerariifolium]